MAEYKAIDEATFAATARGRTPAPRAVSARFDKRTQRVVVKLDTGIDFAFDPQRAKGLIGVASDDLVGVKVEGAGNTLHFPRLDVDLGVGRLLENFVGPMDWTRKEAQADASRRNGKLGGRPRKAPVAA